MSTIQPSVTPRQGRIRCIHWADGDNEKIQLLGSCTRMSAYSSFCWTNSDTTSLCRYKDSRGLARFKIFNLKIIVFYFIFSKTCLTSLKCIKISDLFKKKYTLDIIICKNPSCSWNIRNIWTCIIPYAFG